MTCQINQRNKQTNKQKNRNVDYWFLLLLLLLLPLRKLVVVVEEVFVVLLLLLRLLLKVSFQERTYAWKEWWVFQTGYWKIITLPLLLLIILCGKKKVWLRYYWFNNKWYTFVTNENAESNTTIQLYIPTASITVSSVIASNSILQTKLESMSRIFLNY